MKGGIYQIENQRNGKRYIGSAVNLKRRWTVHLRSLRSGQHYNRHLQAAYDKYGEQSLILSILEYVESERLIEREQYYFDALSPEYNLCPIAGSPLGYRHTPETRKKISKALGGERNPNYGIRGRQSPNYGRRHSEETKHRMSESKKGERNAFYGKRHSKKTREQMSKAHMGERNFMFGKRNEQNPNYGRQQSEEARQNNSKAHMGKCHSEETKRKISEALKGNQNCKGKTLSDETRRKISEVWTPERRQKQSNWMRRLNEKRARCRN